jgi:hypothetical protein
MENGGGDLAAVGGVYEERADRVCTIVHPDYKIFFSHMAFFQENNPVFGGRVIPVKITFIFLEFKKYFGRQELR